MPLTKLIAVQADKPDAVILTGDLSYADDYNADDRFGYQPRWDIWGRFTQFLFAYVPLITTIGRPPMSPARGGPCIICTLLRGQNAWDHRNAWDRLALHGMFAGPILNLFD